MQKFTYPRSDNINVDFLSEKKLYQKSMSCNSAHISAYNWVYVIYVITIITHMSQKITTTTIIMIMVMIMIVIIM